MLGAPPYTEGRSPFNYIGFYGQTFAPTDTLTLIWQPGVPPSSADAFAGFNLTSAVVLVATPEPTTAAFMQRCREYYTPLSGGVVAEPRPNTIHEQSERQ